MHNRYVQNSKYGNSILHQLPQDGKDVPKHAEILKDQTFNCVCNFCIHFVKTFKAY